MTTVNPLDLPPGPELDRAVCEAFGWTPQKRTDANYIGVWITPDGQLWRLPRVSTSLDCFFRSIANKGPLLGCGLAMEFLIDDGEWYVTITNWNRTDPPWATGETLAHALCRVALRAAMKEEKC